MDHLVYFVFYEFVSILYSMTTKRKRIVLCFIVGRSKNEKYQTTGYRNSKNYFTIFNILVLYIVFDFINNCLAFCNPLCVYWLEMAFSHCYTDDWSSNVQGSLMFWYTSSCNHRVVDIQASKLLTCSIAQLQLTSPPSAEFAVLFSFLI